MIFFHDPGKVGAVNMHIDLGRGDAFMPQHLLYGAKVGPILEKVRGK